MLWNILIIICSCSNGTITANFTKKAEIFISISISEEVYPSGASLTTGPYCTASYRNSSSDSYKNFTKTGATYSASVSENGYVNISLPSGTVWGNNGKQYRCLGVYYNGNNISTSFKVSSQFNISDTSGRNLIVRYEEI